MTGGELQALVTGLADDLGLWWAHFPDSRRQFGHPGWVDLVILGWHGGLFTEIKGSGDKRSKSQVSVGVRLHDIGLDYRLWTPRQWHDGIIHQELYRIR